MGGKEASEGVFVADVGVDELDVGRDGGEVARDQAVDDRNFVTGGEELIDGDATDVACAADDEDVQWVYSSKRLKTRQAFWPPKPKLLVRTTSTSALRD